MPTQDELFQDDALVGDIDVDKANVDKLHKNAIGLPGVLYFCKGSTFQEAQMFHQPIRQRRYTICNKRGPFVESISSVGRRINV
jgi:hypothetical protein